MPRAGEFADEWAVLAEASKRWDYDAMFHARVERAALIAKKGGVPSRIGDLRMAAAVALVLEERADPEGGPDNG